MQTLEQPAADLTQAVPSPLVICLFSHVGEAPGRARLMDLYLQGQAKAKGIPAREAAELVNQHIIDYYTTA